jgi:hypothetical protein
VRRDAVAEPERIRKDVNDLIEKLRSGQGGGADPKKEEKTK